DSGADGPGPQDEGEGARADRAAGGDLRRPSLIRGRISQVVRAFAATRPTGSALGAETNPWKERIMKALLLATSFLVLGAAMIPGFAQSLPEKTGVNQAMGIAPKTQDFVTEAAQSDMLEIASSKLAS